MAEVFFGMLREQSGINLMRVQVHLGVNQALARRMPRDFSAEFGVVFPVARDLARGA